MKNASVLDGADSLLDVDFASEGAEFLDQVFAHSCSLIAPDRMRMLGDVFKMCHCARRGKGLYGSQGANGWRRSRSENGQSARQKKTKPKYGWRDLVEAWTVSHWNG